MSFYLWPQISAYQSTTQPVILDSVQTPASVVEATLKNEKGAKVTPTPEQVPLVLEASEKRQISILDEILLSKNDNDQRLDTELRHLSAKVKRALEQKYQNTPSELRNSRGTIALLIGRDLNSPEDLEFLKNILNEPPCLSLESCQTTPTGDDDHSRGAMGVTLVYPQMVTLTMLDRYLGSAEGAPELKRAAKEALESARHNPNSMIVSKANQILEKSP